MCPLHFPGVSLGTEKHPTGQWATANVNVFVCMCVCVCACTESGVGGHEHLSI